jgi:hypothetical protein
MKLYYNKDRDKTVAISEGAAVSTLVNLRKRGYTYICTVYQLGKDVIDLGQGTRQWFKEEPLALEAKVELLEMSVKRLEILATEHGWDNHRIKSVELK